MYKEDPLLFFYKHKDYPLCREEYFNFLKESNSIYGYLIPSLYHPFLLTNKEFLTLKEQAEKLSVLLSRMAYLYLKHSEIAEYFNFPESLHEYLKIDPGYSTSVPISRYDGFWDGNLFRFCEFNTDGTSGMNDITLLDHAFTHTSLGKHTAARLQLKHFDLIGPLLNILIQSYREYGRSDVPNIAITDYAEKGTNDEFLFLKKAFIERGYPTEICDLRNFELKKDGVWCGNFKVDLVYRRAVTDDILTFENDSKVFLEAYSKQAMCVVGPLRSHIVHSKLLFSFFYSTLAENYFTEDEILFIRKHIPWTARLTNESSLISEIIENKDDYFLKPHDSYATKGVYCGMDFSHEEWASILENLIKQKANNYLAQKKINIPKKSFVVDDAGNMELFNVKLDPYFFGGRCCGFYTRISNKNIISINKDGMLLPCFVGK